MKFLPSLLFLFYAIAFSQSADSLKLHNHRLQSDTTITAQRDSLALPDSLKAKIKPQIDTLVQIHQKPFNNKAQFINRREFDFSNYRYAGDILKSFNLNFLNDYGSIGQPNETYLYGVGSNGIGYFEDGIMQNSRLQNFFDLNSIQTESIDSVEVSPLPRGFLYGSFNNMVSVNFITRDFVPPQPYTRIKYYQGPNGEAMIDGLFNQKIYNKFDVSFDFTNRKFDYLYVNSAYSNWQTKLKIKYYLNNKINIQGTYGFENSTAELMWIP
jgi:outer membrane cobalamin receptor